MEVCAAVVGALDGVLQGKDEVQVEQLTELVAMREDNLVTFAA